jgi:hypothetical protein
MKALRLLAAAGALFFMMSTTPSAAPAASCAACDNCYPNLPCLKCASYVAHSIGNCCGSASGWASCVNNDWGFYASCPGWSCQCNAMGSGCTLWY